MEMSPILPQKLKKQFRIVMSFKYLGIWVFIKTEEYLNYNLVLLLDKFKGKSKIWTKLPLSLVGCANLIKMFWGPQLLYVLSKMDSP